MTAPAADAELTWTPLARRLGTAGTTGQRSQILTAVARLHWSADITGQLLHLHGAASRTLIATLQQSRDPLAQLGIAAMSEGRQLVGLQYTDGTRSYLLERHTGTHDEVTQVLVQTRATAGHHVA